MKRALALLVLMAGCGEMASQGFDLSIQPRDMSSTDLAGDAGVVQDMTAPDVIQYDVMAPFTVSGMSPIGTDGAVYTIVPSAPLASDPWNLMFCYKAICIVLQEPIDSIPVGETASLGTSANGQLSVTGDVSCSSWTQNSTITWYSAAPLTWHIAISAACTNSAVTIHGDWKRIN